MSPERTQSTLDPAVVAVSAAAIMDVWAGRKTWRDRLEESEFLESADWLMAVDLATAVLLAAKEHTR